jgi:hypothetical protein
MGRSLFIGVVTHGRSQFREEAAALVESLAMQARESGFEVTTAVSDRDDYDAHRFPITRGLLLRSVTAQSVLEYRWRRYLAAGIPRRPLARAGRLAKDAALLGGTLVVRTGRYFGPWPLSGVDRLAGSGAVIRLLNIDLSHLRMLNEAAAVAADWALVVEDDASTASAAEAMSSLIAAMDLVDGSGPAFVNASHSISLAALGIAELLEPVPGGGGVLVARRPVTNTVCAILYGAAMVRWLAARIESDGLVPVLPIDWRLNRAVMAAFDEGVLGPGSCLVLEPAPFVQRSMHGA